jgi:hypothetical protein
MRAGLDLSMAKALAPNGTLRAAIHVGDSTAGVKELKRSGCVAAALRQSGQTAAVAPNC